MGEAWEELRVGDRVRVVRLPSAWDNPGYQVFPCTRRLYRKLIERRRPLRVYELDGWGLPWVRCRFRLRSGGWESHFLALNDDSWVGVGTGPGARAS